MKNKKAKKRSLFAQIVLLIVIIVMLGAMITVIYALNYKPSVIYSDDVPFDTNPNVIEADPDVEEEVKPNIDTNFSRKSEDFYTFLAIGRDLIGLNTDVIMLLSLNVTKNEIAVMQIPRDTYIKVNDVSRKINSVYASLYNAAVRNKDKDPYTTAMTDFADILQKNLNVKIDFYGFFNLAGFRNIVDILGGVEVDVPFNMYYEDPEQKLYINLKKGLQTLDGAKAEQFIRFRDSYIEGDIGRVNAQKIFLSSLMKSIKNNLTVTKLPSLIMEGIKNVNSSISVNDCIYFAKEILNLDLENMIIFTLPGTDTRADGDSGAWYYVMHRADTLALINRFFNVYTSDITESIFDKNRAFTDVNRNHIDKIYKTPASEDIEELIKYADDIYNNGVYIPRLY